MGKHRRRSKSVVEFPTLLLDSSEMGVEIMLWWGNNVSMTEIIESKASDYDISGSTWSEYMNPSGNHSLLFSSQLKRHNVL
jgi:hypothetical protein